MSTIYIYICLEPQYSFLCVFCQINVEKLNGRNKKKKTLFLTYCMCTIRLCVIL